MSKTEQYLKEAFAGESQANRRYLAFAVKADQEGRFFCWPNSPESMSLMLTSISSTP